MATNQNTESDAYWVVVVNRATGTAHTLGPNAADEAHGYAQRCNDDPQSNHAAFVVAVRP